MNAEEVKSIITAKAAVTGFDTGTIEENTNLVGTGIFDSLQFMDLLAALESKSGLEIDFSELDPAEFTTFGFLVRYFGEKN